MLLFYIDKHSKLKVVEDLKKHIDEIYSENSFYAYAYEKSYIYSSDKKNRHLLVTSDLNMFERNKAFYEKFDKDTRPHFVKFIDLREYETFSYANVKVTKTKKFKAVKPLSLMTKLSRLVASRAAPVNHVRFDDSIFEAFEEFYNNVDFFKFSEQCDEYRFKLSMVGHSGRVTKLLNLNVGELSVVYCPNFLHVEQDDESKERHPQRATLRLPVYELNSKKYVAEFNDKNKNYKQLVDDLRLLKEMEEI
ncbi:hypothetical protein [Pseudomonas sp. XWY-1]|uniref:hypothetical protein n=1 Tax=Pseudomonas sp. XWY-1 TaxID=2069256 RepID=UPI000CF54C51|nr:hypothetical protein [Pseudomonas sp. XWY-1]